MSPGKSISRIWNVSPATLDELRKEFDSAIGTVTRSVRDSVYGNMPLALWEDDHQIVLDFEVPGVSASDLDVQMESGTLTVTAERHAPKRTGAVRHNEHRYGKWQRRVRLDESLNLDSVTAELENGLLTITIPRRVEAQPVRVPVRVPERTRDAGSNDPSTESAPDSGSS